MKKIRKNVFETNSSSTHSICIARGDDNDLTDIPSPDEDGNIYVNSGEYGWDICSYDNVLDRLSYAATYALNRGYDWNKEKGDRFDYNNPQLIILTEVIKEFTGANEVIYDEGSDGDFYKHGYIDHQSIDEAAEIFESMENLIHFLFNPRSWFQTDNDNH